MLKRIALGLTLAVSLAVLPLTFAPGIALLHTAGPAANGFNDKMLLIHSGQEICVDWSGWQGHILNHGDTLLGSCDAP